MKFNLFSGSIKFGSKRLPILWTGQHAQHLAEEHIADSVSHPFLHVTAQQWAGKCKYTQGRSYGFARFTTGMVVICPVLKKRNFVILRSCYLKPIQNLPAAEKQSLRGVSVKKDEPVITWSEKDLAFISKYGLKKSQLEADILSLFSKKPKHRKTKK